MARLAKIAKSLKKPKFKVRVRNRCRVCGRARAFIRKFEMCRICLRGMALKGAIAGVVKASWQELQENYANASHRRFCDVHLQRRRCQESASGRSGVQVKVRNCAHLERAR